MRIICDAPGQTCNRLWTYVTTVARCVALKKKMMIIFYDWTIEDFPNLLHCPFIYFPLYQKWYLERGNGWNNYKGATWKITHSKTWDKIFSFFGCKKGWALRNDTQYLEQAMPELKKIFEPKKEITEKADAKLKPYKDQGRMVIGVHVRRGDYATHLGGRYYYSFEEYRRFMLQAKEIFKDRNPIFFISSDEQFDLEQFQPCECIRFGKEPSGAVLDLHTLSVCDAIMGPNSTFSRWASFIGEKPICWLEDRAMTIEEKDFSPMKDFFLQANGHKTEI